MIKINGTPTIQIFAAENKTYERSSLAPNVHPKKSELHPKALIRSRPPMYMKLHEYSSALVTRAISDTTGNSDALLDPDLHRRLVVGTKTMIAVRETMNKGRGNVDGNDPQFPEAAIRSQIAYDLRTEHLPDFFQKVMSEPTPDPTLIRELLTVIAETTQAGNCDFHASACKVYGSQKMAAQDAIAVVMQEQHTFAELRASPPQEQFRMHDVIMDSWATGAHAVLREDSAMGRNISYEHATPENVNNRTITLSANENLISKNHFLTRMRDQFTQLDIKGKVEDIVSEELRKPEQERLTLHQYPLEATQIAQHSDATRQAMESRNDYITQYQHTQENGVTELDDNAAHRGYESGAMRAILAARLLRQGNLNPPPSFVRPFYVMPQPSAIFSNTPSIHES